MDETIKKQKFVQLQFCLLLLVCTLLPDFTSLIGLPSVDIPVLCCKIIGLVGGGLALFTFYKSLGQALPMPFLVIAGSGLVLTLLTLFPGMPNWLNYIGLVVLLIAFFMSKGSVGIQWKNAGAQGAYLVLMAILLRVYDSIGDTTVTGIAALIGLVLYIVGLGKLKANLDAKGAQGISRLKVAIILGIVAIIFGWIPLLGSIVAGILFIIGFIFEFLGYGAMKQSASLGFEGQQGAGHLRISMIILLVGAIVDLIPFTGMVVGFISLVALWLIFKGWNMILFGIEQD